MGGDAPDDIEVVTVATSLDGSPEKPGGFARLERSCRRNGLPLTVLGSGVPWTGSSLKLRLLRDRLDDLPEDRIVLFVDAYDSLLLPSRRRIVEKFLEFEKPIVVSAEKGCWPDPELAERYPRAAPLRRARGQPLRAALRPEPPSPSPFRYLNSGGFMGYAGALRDALREMVFPEWDRDQRLLTRYFLGHPGGIALDYGADIFQTLFEVPADAFSLVEGEPVRILSAITRSDPCVLHGNGPGWPTLEEICRRLNEWGWP